jgi:hypothetical protein
VPLHVLILANGIILLVVPRKDRTFELRSQLGISSSYVEMRTPVSSSSSFDLTCNWVLLLARMHGYDR